MDPADASVVLGTGRYTVLVTAAATGVSRWNGLQLTGWSGDPVEDADGVFVYLRDVERGTVWSAGAQPVGPGERHAARLGPEAVEIERLDDGIETTLAITVPRAADVELRRLTLLHRGPTPRRIEVTTYAEIVLNDPAAHAAHPAFSKLFVETEHTGGVLLASRRPRSRGEARPWMVAWLGGDGAVEWDTARATALGRGHTVARPLALEAPLAGRAGSVLDPVFVLRRTVTLAPGVPATLVLVLGAGETRAAVLALVERYRGVVVVPRATGARVALPPAPALRFRPSGYATGDAPPTVESLRFDNGHGGFAADGRAYVIRLDERVPVAARRPPMPWINVIANPSFGFLVSEAGAGYTWSRNSREHRVTPWSNDPIVDPHGEALYLRDEEGDVFWSPLPGPVPASASFEVRHGFGWSRWRHASHGLAHDVEMLVAPDEAVKIVRLRVTNPGPRARRLSAFAYYRLVLGVLPAGGVVTEHDEPTGAVLARNPASVDFADGVAFAAAPGASSWSGDRATFLGRYGSPASPLALRSGGPLDGRVGAGLDPCAALQVPLEVPAGATVERVFLLGEAADVAGVRALVARYGAPGAAARTLEAVQASWRDTLERVQVETPAPDLDVLVNGWLPYQNLSCRLWGRSAFYQSGGAFGFRDQLQDAAALVHLRPDLTRAQIVLHAAHQFVEGDVLHWWHPPRDGGTRTRFSDDLLWLPYLTAFYVATTGDAAVLDERAGFVTARPLAAGEDEAYLLPSAAAESATVYEHCCRAIDRSLAVGAHGLPLMGTGDWNDGMNRVGREGRGESVWLGFFLYALLGDFAPLCDARGDGERATRYRAHRERLRRAIEEAAWDGAWYRRAWYDDGTVLGSAASDECQIDALAQAWAVISGAAAPARAGQAMDAVERLLVVDDPGLVRLLAPPFDRTPHDPGYIKGYVPGIRENGGQYTHAALWVVRALAELGRRDRAAALLRMLGPLHHARDRAAVAVYQVEPYVVAADVYGVAPHLGRGGWTWYTGSAGWMYRVALESILGVTREGGDTLRVRPCIPDAWPSYRVTLGLPDGRTRYVVEVVNPDGCAEVVCAATVDGAAVAVDGGARLPLREDGGVHRVTVTLGRR